jgi:hypothetical protein
MRRSWLFVLSLVPFLLLLPPIQGRAQSSSLDGYRIHLEKLRALVESCKAKASACDANAVGNDEQVQLQGLGAGANVNSFEARYGWLRDALKSAQNAGNKNRDNELQAAESRLDESLSEITEGQSQPDMAVARRRADGILGHPEFATAREDSLWAQLWEHIALWLDRLFGHVAQFGERSPWIGPAMEWALMAIALAGLAVWAMRVLRRQRLAVRMEAARQIEPWEEAARNWRALADERAAAGDWREAVHCVYWASIAVLEGRKLWAPNRSRTPREYVRLLEAGSARWKLLRQQTQGFEHVWYGLNDAARKDYDRAVELHDGLRTA